MTVLVSYHAASHILHAIRRRPGEEVTEEPLSEDGCQLVIIGHITELSGPAVNGEKVGIYGVKSQHSSGAFNGGVQRRLLIPQMHEQPLPEDPLFYPFVFHLQDEVCEVEEFCGGRGQERHELPAQQVVQVSGLLTGQSSLYRDGNMTENAIQK